MKMGKRLLAGVTAFMLTATSVPMDYLQVYAEELGEGNTAYGQEATNESITAYGQEKEQAKEAVTAYEQDETKENIISYEQKESEEGVVAYGQGELYQQGEPQIKAGIYKQEENEGGLAESQQEISVTESSIDSEEESESNLVQGICGSNAAYTLNVDTGELVISGSGAVSGEGRFTGYSSKITSLKLEEGITSIGSSMFSGCSGLKEIILPDTVTEIGRDAFYDTAFLNNATEEFVILGNGFLCKYNGTDKNVTVPDTVKRIADNVFQGKTEIENVTLPDGLLSIGKEAFDGCTSLTNVTVPSGLGFIGGEAFRDTPFIKAHTEEQVILGKVFYKYQGTGEMVEIPEGIISVSDYAFVFATDLEKVKIPSTVTTIGYGAFVGCTSMITVVIPENVTKIGDYAFGYYCANGFEGSFEKMSAIYLTGSAGSAAESYATANGIQYFTETDFSGTCGENLTWNLNPDTGALTIEGTGAMTEYDVTDSPFYNLKYFIRTVDIKKGVTTVGQFAFRSCYFLEEVTFPEGMSKIGFRAFEYCRRLKDPVLPEGVTMISTYAFANCDRIQSICMPKSLTQLEYAAFDKSANLKEILVQEENETYSSSEGIVYNKAQTELIMVPCGYEKKTFRIPDTVNYIEFEALQENRGIETLYVPQSVTFIAADVLYNCSSLKNIIFEGKAPQILGISTFFGTENRKVYCDLSEEGWTAIQAELSSSGNIEWIDLAEESAVQELSIQAEKDTLNAKESMMLSAKLDPKKAMDFVWSSSDTTVAVVSGKGKLTGIKPGQVTITVTSEDGAYSASKDFQVTGEAFQIESGSITALQDEISYTYPRVVTQQIICEKLQGMYLFSIDSLKFYSFVDGSCEDVYQYPGCVSAYADKDKLYLLSEKEWVVYDLIQQKCLSRFFINEYNGTAIGVDNLGRIYIAATNGAKEHNHKIFLYSPEGKLLSETKVGTEVYSFDGFDSSNGNFYMETYYDYYSWGYSHPGRGLTMGNVTDNNIRTIQTQSTFLENGMITRNLSCIEYLCQNSYMLHQNGAALLGDKYLLATSATKGQLSVMDSDKEKLNVCKIFTRKAEEYPVEFHSSFDTNSIGVRGVYNEKQGSILVYENDKTINAYNPVTWEKMAQYKTQHYVFNMLIMGETLVLIEKEDGVFYIEYLDVSAPEQIKIVAEKDTMQVGDTQQLSVDAGKYSGIMCEWTSSNEQIVSVTESGTISAWKEGTVTISCRSKAGNCNDSIIMTVTEGKNMTPVSNRTELSGQITNNVSGNNYTLWSKPVNSYLMENEDNTLTRIENTGAQKLIVENYSPQYELKDSRTLEYELEYFGGFYSGEQYNFLVFGQNNETESDSCEVMRIVKYSKSWERLDSCSVFGANTYIPFKAGSLRMTETGNRLYLYTCHEMYKSSDGKHHQSNMTFVLNEESMEMEQSYYDIMNIAQAGYVSHSFNQFIQTDGTYVYRVDHGDANPRAISITRCKVDGNITNVAYTLPLKICGYPGANATGVSIGGMELSGENCLIVGNSVNQSNANTYNASGKRNIFLTVTSKELNVSRQIWLTQYEETDTVTVRTPQIVKLNEEQFLVMWEEVDSMEQDTKVRLATIDGTGKVTSQLANAQMKLSDCQPVVTEDGLVKWYVADESKLSLYMVNPYDFTNERGNNLINHVHEYAKQVTREADCTTYGEVVYTCDACGTVKYEELEKTGHLETEVRNAREATTTQKGYTGDTYCKACGTLISRGTSIPMITKMPTETPKPTEPGEITEPTKPGGTPEPTQPGGTPEPTKPEGTPEPTKAEGTPEPTKAEGTPEPTKPEGTPEPTKAEGTPEPTKPGETPEPTNPGGIAEPTQPGGVVEPTKPGVTPEPTQGGEAAKPTQPGETVEPTKPGETAEPTQPGETVEPTKPEDMTEPTKAGEILEPTKPGGIAEPTKAEAGLEPTKPGDIPEPTKAEESLEPTKPGDILEPTKAGETPKPTKPDETTNAPKKTLEITSFTTSVASGSLEKGKTVKLKASTKNASKKVQYRFVVKQKGGKASTIRNYSTKSYVNWKPLKAGTYTLTVYAKDNNVTVKKSISKYVVRNKFAVSSLKASPASKKAEVGETVKITVKAVGGSGKYKYKYVYTLGRSKKIISDYSTKKSIYWKPKKKGTYKLTVYVKDTGMGKTLKKNLGNYVVK